MTWIVLLPSPLGFCLFVRWPRQHLRACSALLHPGDLRDAVGSLGGPITTVLIGRRHAEVVADAVLAAGELVVVPDAWVRGVPAAAFSRRAEVALRAARAHAAGAIQRHARVSDDGQLSLF
jgi:hypothetical protein